MNTSVSFLAITRSGAIVALLTAFGYAFRLNAPSAGFVLLVGVLILSSRERLPVATAAAIAATLAYNFFFFEPKYTLKIADPEDWIALATFLLTSLLANRLLVRERREAERAESSREEIEALYEMSVALLRGPGGIEQAGDAVVRYLGRIGAASGGVILFGASPQQQQVLAWTGAPPGGESEREVSVPLMIDGRIGGALVMRGRAGTRSALESAANLAAFAIERERFLHERARNEALHEANELKTSLLQAVSHDLKSPLTVLAVESEALERTGALSHVRVIRDEVARLHRRIDNLLSVARFEAGIVSPRIEPTPAADLLRAARESLPTVTGARAVQTTVHGDTPELLVDPSLALEIVVNLLENAHAASPAQSPIELHAAASADAEGRVWVEVRDRGRGFSLHQLEQAPDVRGPGLGMELARTLAALCGGTVEWLARPGGGTIARLDVPAARTAVPEPVA